MKSAGTQGWFSVQSYFNPTQEEPEQQNSSSYGSLGTTTTTQSSNQDHVVGDWDWDHNSIEPADQQKPESSENGAAEKNEAKSEAKSEPQDHGWDEHGDWGEADSWSNESWSTPPKSRTKAKELGKKGD